MSKSKQLTKTTKKALWRQGRSLLIKPLDTDDRFIDVLYTPDTADDLFPTARERGSLLELAFYKRISSLWHEETG